MKVKLNVVIITRAKRLNMKCGRVEICVRLHTGFSEKAMDGYGGRDRHTMCERHVMYHAAAILCLR